MTSDLSCLLHDLPSHTHPLRTLPPLSQTMYSQRTGFYQLDWRSQASQSSHYPAALAPSTWTNAGPSQAPSLWPAGPPDFLLPFHHYSPRSRDAEYSNCAYYSVARSDTSSAVSRDSDLSPSPEVAEVVCNAPLVAPIPLPYHSPTFLLYDLPDDDEDLSHPPYTHRPHKRKRARDEEEDADVQQREFAVPAAKRRSIAEGSGHWNASHRQWGSVAAPVTSLRQPAAGFSRRNRAR